MLLPKEKINAKLLFTISFCVTALAIYLLKINSFGSVLEMPHNFIQNVLFINITFLGSGIFCMGLIVYLFYKKEASLALLIISATCFSVLLIQSIKMYLHNDGLKFFFEDRQYIFNSVSQKGPFFLSGHTAIAFCLATILSLHFNDRRKAVYLFLTASIIAYSRIYLGHHTLVDLFAGVFTGIASATLCFYCSLNFSKLKQPRSLISGKLNNPKGFANPYSFE